MAGRHELLLFLALCGCGAVAAGQHQAAHGAVPEEPGELFRSSCISCHAPPDPRFAVERAWLEQVLDTA